MRYTSYAVALTSLLLISVANGLTPAEYQAYIDEINAAAKAQKKTVSPTPVAPVTPKTTKPAPTTVSVTVSYNGSCPILSRNLSRGGRGADVSALQTFLISQKLLASDSATGYFGPLTEAAVRKWQAQTGLASGGTPATTGYGNVGPKTRAAIALCGTAKTAVIPPTVTSSPSQCTIYTRPTCASGQQLFPGEPDSRGCAGPWRCVSLTVSGGGSGGGTGGISCPSFPQPTCTANQHIEYGAPDANQCAGAPRCADNVSPPPPPPPPPSSSSCTFNGTVIANGASATGYQSPTVPAGSSCASENRLCTNGTLSGSYQYAACSVLPQTNIGAVVTDPTYGAKGDCVADDTVAFQKAIDAAYGPNGLGKVVIPATSKCYLVRQINGTKRSNIVVEGVGDQSVIKVSGTDSAGNWWDLSGSSEVTLRNFKIIEGDVTPKTIFLWGNVTQGISTGLLFDRVNVDAKSSAAHLYAFDYRGLTMRDGTWYQRENGIGGHTNPSLRTSVVRLDNVNSFPSPATSAYMTLGTGAVSWATSLTNMNLIDSPPGFGAQSGNRDNNATFICVQCGGLFNMTGGRIAGLGIVPVVLWNYVEGVVFDSMTIGPTDASTNTIHAHVHTGGSPADNTTGNLTLKTIFFEGSPTYAYIMTENPGPSGQLALGHFQLINTDIGYNANNAYLMAPAGLACTSPVAQGWIGQSSRIDAVRMKMVFCGNADLSTTINDAPPPGGIITPPGTTQDGCKLRGTTPYNCTFGQ